MPSANPLTLAHEAIDRLYGEITSPVNHRAMRLVTEAHAALEEATKDGEFYFRVTAGRDGSIELAMPRSDETFPSGVLERLTYELRQLVEAFEMTLDEQVEQGAPGGS